MLLILNSFHLFKRLFVSSAIFEMYYNFFRFRLTYATIEFHIISVVFRKDNTRTDSNELLKLISEIEIREYVFLYYDFRRKVL